MRPAVQIEPTTKLASAEPMVVLASMPWAPVTEPSLALGLLTASLERQGIRSKAAHLNLELLRWVSYETYTSVAEYWGLNEFVFTGGIAPEIDEPQLEALVERCGVQLQGVRSTARYPTIEALLDMLLRFRSEVAPQYLDACADRILQQRPTMLGLTCMFDQTLASVALAKIVKERAPSVQVILGGYALQGEPGEEVLNAFPWIDAIARGDGEEMIVQLASASIGRTDLRAINGLLVRDAPPRPQRNVSLERSPDPAYRDWFVDLAKFEEDTGIQVITQTLPIESSRGCWWGQHKHCVFCGIDEDTLKFRHKSASRTLDMLAHMRATYGEHEFRFSDYILPRPYFETLLPTLADADPRYRLKCEIKANQSREKVAALARAGFTEVQPGIESFSSNVLRLMDKGVSGIENVALLKYGYLERIVIHYNYIYGIPGETADDYRAMIQAIPRLYHLIPPVSRTEAIITRFAPLHANPEKFGGPEAPVHHSCYDVLFNRQVVAETGFNLDRYGYYFDHYPVFDDDISGLYSATVKQINHWKKQHRDQEVWLSFEDDGNEMRVSDNRYGHEEVYTLPALERLVYIACDAAPALTTGVVDRVAAAASVEPGAVLAAIDVLDERRLIWRDSKRVFGLAIPAEVTMERLTSGWRNHWTAIHR